MKKTWVRKMIATERIATYTPPNGIRKVPKSTEPESHRIPTGSPFQAIFAAFAINRLSPNVATRVTISLRGVIASLPRSSRWRIPK